MVTAADFSSSGTTPATHRYGVRETYSHLGQHGTATWDDLRQYVELRSPTTRPNRTFPERKAVVSALWLSSADEPVGRDSAEHAER
jgi:hypothetical protein